VIYEGLVCVDSVIRGDDVRSDIICSQMVWLRASQFGERVHLWHGVVAFLQVLEYHTASYTIFSEPWLGYCSDLTRGVTPPEYDTL